MSNELRYDPLLVTYLAAELDRELRGRACAAAPAFAADLSVSLPLEGGAELRADLHPRHGWITLREPGEDREDDLDAVCTGVSAPPDERRILIHLKVTGRFREQGRTLVLELPTNQWNAILIDDAGRILQILRARRAGVRSLFPGNEYTPAPTADRYGVGSVDSGAARDLWERTVESVEPTERVAALVRAFAWTGTPNAGWILEPEDADERFARWWWLRGLPAPAPVLQRCGNRRTPYPVPLTGRSSAARTSLLAAMAEVAAGDRASAGEMGSAGPAVERSDEVAAALPVVLRRAATARRKLARLRDELSRAGEAERLRALGDLLLAKIHEVPRGRPSVTLEDWEGRRVEVRLDPSLSPAENAAAQYEEARRRARAEQRLPDLIRQAESELARAGELLKEVESGRVPGAVLEEARRRPAGRAGSDDVAPSLPYRVFRTSGGLEVRVGRGAKENDRLTFRESAPNDVWLHARSVPGSHVILRWTEPEGSPPARDLAEAAQLAALFSRARTSGTVAVDWTRRKYVRKPRGAAPGLVVPQRVRTIFVEPDESMLERLREG